jgi:hypothetical protein
MISGLSDPSISFAYPSSILALEVRRPACELTKIWAFFFPFLAS